MSFFFCIRESVMSEPDTPMHADNHVRSRLTLDYTAKKRTHGGGCKERRQKIIKECVSVARTGQRILQNSRMEAARQAASMHHIRLPD